MALRLYNTATRSVEDFHPLNPPTVSLYTCGPTVYNFAHIGNLRTYVFEDVLVRTLAYLEYDVTRVMNVTDVGHLVSDADTGEDKMALGAQREGKTVWDIAQQYWDAFRADMAKLHILEPDVWCRATEHIDEQRQAVEDLTAKGFTYVIEDGIYFDTSKFPSYAEFAGLDIEGMRAGHRVEMAEGKRNPTDFAVWKFSPKGQQRLMEWPNPCGIEGMGFPGWHIECSAMAIRYLGEHLDIHCGGTDHVRVHHTNEIAQAEACLGHRWCRWWMHGEFLTLPKNDNGEGGKMSKSSGEFLTLQLLIDKGYDPVAYRYFLLGAHYRQQLAFTWDGLDAAAAALKKLKRAVLEYRKGYDPATAKPFEVRLLPFRQALEDDLNAPRALASLWAVIRNEDDAPTGDVYATLLEMDKVLALGMTDWEEESLGDEAAEIEGLIAERAQARTDRNFARADEIRDALLARGIELLDGPEGTTWRKTD